MRKSNKSSVFINSKVMTTISVSLVLFLLGLVVFLSLFTDNISNSIKESLSFDIVLQDNTNKKEIQYVQDALDKSLFVKSSIFLSKEKAIKQLAAELEENPEDFLGFNPLPDLIVIRLKRQYANLDSLQVIKNYLKKYSNNIKTIEYREETLKKMTNNISKIGFILLSVTVVLFLISFTLINNTIRLTVYSKRFLIRTMQLIGVKRRNIYKPFIISSIFIGMIASAIACGLLYCLIYYVISNFLYIDRLNLNSLLITFGSVFIFGILISFITTYFSVNKYIDIGVNNLRKIIK